MIFEKKVPVQELMTPLTDVNGDISIRRPGLYLELRCMVGPLPKLLPKSII